MLTPYTEQPASGSHPQDPSYFQSETGHSMPPPDMNTIAHQSLPTTTGLALPQGQVYPPAEPSMIATPTYPQSAPSQPNPPTVSPEIKKRQPRGSKSASRRPLAQSQDTQTMNPRPSSTTSWMAANTSAAPSVVDRENTASPIYTQATANRQRLPTSADRMQNNSPRLHTSATHQQQVPSPQQPAHAVPAIQSQSRKSPFPGHQRTSSRQGRGSQSRTPNAEQAMNRGYRPPPPQTQSTNDLNVSASYSNHAQGSNTSNNPTYESLSNTHTTRATSATHGGYEYSRATPTSTSTLNPATTSTANQWPSSSQSSQARSYDTRYSSNSYSQTRNMAQPAASAHNFDMRSAVQAQSMPAASKIKQQTYSQYPSQMQAHQQQPAQKTGGQQMNHNPEWYGFNNGNNNSFTSANHGWM